jgi:hypothetical protein
VNHPINNTIHPIVNHPINNTIHPIINKGNGTIPTLGTGFSGFAGAVGHDVGNAVGFGVSSALNGVGTVVGDVGSAIGGIGDALGSIF